MAPHIAAALATSTTADLLDILGEILEPSQDGPFGRGYAEDGEFEAFLDEVRPITEEYRALYDGLAMLIKREDV